MVTNELNEQVEDAEKGAPLSESESAEVSKNGSEKPHRFALEDLEELDPMRYWQELTERQIANFDRRIATIQETLGPLLERRDALKRALAAAASKTLSGKVVTRMKLPSAPSAPRENAGRGVRYPAETIDRMREIIRENPTMKNGEIASLAGVPASIVSYYKHAGAR